MATPEDLAEWAYLLYSGKVLEPNSLSDMMAPVMIGGNSTNYGLGYIYKRYKNKNFHGHGGTTLQNSRMDYAEDLGYAIVINANEQGATNKTITIENLMIDVLESEMPKYPYEPISVSEVNEFSTPSIFPNPAIDFVWLRGEETSNLQVFDLNGS